MMGLQRHEGFAFGQSCVVIVVRSKTYIHNIETSIAQESILLKV